jgi:hypothetical protein
MTNWDLSAVDILKGTPDDDIDNESEANEDSESIISVADFTTFLYPVFDTPLSIWLI